MTTKTIEAQSAAMDMDITARYGLTFQAAYTLADTAIYSTNPAIGCR